jgi:hypothetical protein
LEPPKFSFSSLSAASAEFVPGQYLKVQAEVPKTELPKAEQVVLHGLADGVFIGDSGQLSIRGQCLWMRSCPIV